MTPTRLARDLDVAALRRLFRPTPIDRVRAWAEPPAGLRALARHYRDILIYALAIVGTVHLIVAILEATR